MATKKPTILLLHGALGSKAQLEGLKTRLEAEKADVYSINFSGHGGEAMPDDFSIQQFGSDVVRFLDRFTDPVHLIGYSMGGYVALMTALHHPDKVAKVVTLGTKFDWSEDGAAHEVKKLNPEKIREKVPAFATVLAMRHHPTDWMLVVNNTAAMMMCLGRKPLLMDAELKQIHHPVLICLGDKDDVADHAYSKQVAATLPCGSFALLPETPHPIEKISIALWAHHVIAHVWAER